MTTRPTNFEAVGLFHDKFDTPSTSSVPEPRMIEGELRKFRLDFILEEVCELEEAYARNDLAAVSDALIDIAYVVLGTGQVHGLPWEDLFDEVQRANMTKERALPDGSNSVRKSRFDIIKPPGWTPPDIAGVLRRHGWKE